MKYATWKWMLCVHCISLLTMFAQWRKSTTRAKIRRRRWRWRRLNEATVNEQLNERTSERETENEQQLRSIKYVINVFQLDI